MSTQRKAAVYDGTTGLSIPHQCIRERAYEIYSQRGRKGGRADGVWLTAEAELKELKTKAADMISLLFAIHTCEPEDIKS